MTYKLEVSDEAHEDIDNTVEYMIQNLENPSAASSFLDDVQQSYLRLKDNPYMFSMCQDLRLQEMGYRKVVIKHYLVLFRVEGNVVYVVRVIYGGRNYVNFVL